MEYKCTKCGKIFDEFKPKSGEPICPDCHAPAVQNFSGKCYGGFGSSAGGCSGGCASCAGCKK